MATVIVSRQHVDEENNLSWVYEEIEDTELLPGETPVPDFLLSPIEL